MIDSTLEDGHRHLRRSASCRARREDEFLLSTYICHPSLCNDNLSGIVLLTALARHLQAEQRRYSYRFLFSPATIGPLDLALAKRGSAPPRQARPRRLVRRRPGPR